MTSLDAFWVPRVEHPRDHVGGHVTSLARVLKPPRVRACANQRSRPGKCARAHACETEGAALTWFIRIVCLFKGFDDLMLLSLHYWEKLVDLTFLAQTRSIDDIVRFFSFLLLAWTILWADVRIGGHDISLYFCILQYRRGWRSGWGCATCAWRWGRELGWGWKLE